VLRLLLLPLLLVLLLLLLVVVLMCCWLLMGRRRLQGYSRGHRRPGSGRSRAPAPTAVGSVDTVNSIWV
jgi:hypothetical protein